MEEAFEELKNSEQYENEMNQLKLQLKKYEAEIATLKQENSYLKEELVRILKKSAEVDPQDSKYQDKKAAMLITNFLYSRRWEI